MKKAVLAFLFIAIIGAFRAAAAAPTANDYPINVHVTSSRLVAEPSAFGSSHTLQRLRVVINGKKYELEHPENRGRLLAPGDYRARLAEDEHKTTYESYQVYEFLFPDQTTRKFMVVGRSE